jgi:uncharacterized damage-inducible protein DinB
MEDLRYPVGRFNAAAEVPHAERAALVASIATTPARLRAAIATLDDAQLETPYREGGWTVRQVVHHVADSHMNAYTRFRLALTEEEPTIRPYNEADWANLEDAAHAPVDISLELLDALHDRLDRLLRTLNTHDYERKLYHPDNGPMTVGTLLRMYEWHGRHHAAHITSLRNRMGWR